MSNQVELEVEYDRDEAFRQKALKRMATDFRAFFISVASDAVEPLIRAIDERQSTEIASPADTQQEVGTQ